MFGFARPAGPNHWPKEDSTVKVRAGLTPRKTSLLPAGDLRVDPLEAGLVDLDDAGDGLVEA